MQRRRLLASVGGLLAAGVAGCTATGTDSPGGDPDDTTTGDPAGDGTTTDPTTADSTTTTRDPTTTGAENAAVEYVVTTGGIPEEIGSVEVTLRAVFVETEADFEHDRCWRDTYEGPHKPTITPIRTPAGACHRSDSVTLDLTEIAEGRSLGPFEAPGSGAAGHGLVATHAAAEYRDGSPVEALKGAGGLRVNLVEGRPEDRYRVEFRVEAYEDRPYRYWLQSTVEESSGRLGTGEASDRTAPAPSAADSRDSGS